MEARMKYRPDRIFVSVDESTKRSIISFQPQDAGDPLTYDDDEKGSRAMTTAQTIVEKYPGSTIHGPHFHAARPASARPRRKPPRRDE